MPAVKANSLAEVPPGTVAEFETANSTFALCNINGTVYCVDGLCPHLEGPLGQGALHGPILVCPWHGWEFDVRTGACEMDESCKLTTYRTVIQDGHIFIQLP